MKGKAEGQEEPEEAGGEGKKRFVLVDGNAVLHRAYHALPVLTTRSGELVNAVYGFALMLLKIFDELHPEYLAVAFDTGKPTFRQQEFIGYQAKRPRMDTELVGQIEKVHDLVRAFNIPIFEVEGYEADDVIGSLAKQAAEEQEESGGPAYASATAGKQGRVETIIVTGDKDLMQVVDENVKLYMPSRGLSEGQIVGREEVIEKMGVSPEKIVDYKGLVGDPSDNYPGVPGIGPKTAVELLRKFGSIEEIYQKIGGIGKIREIGGKTTVRKLAEGAESAVLSKKLATISTDVPIKLKLEDCMAKAFDKEKVGAFFRELGFRSLIGRLMVEEVSRDQEDKKNKKDKRQGTLF